MGVKGLTDIEQPRYIKKIRLGIKGEKGVPQNVDHFVIEGAPEIEAVYGKQPKELHAMFYSDDPDITMPTWNEWYDASHFLLCRGDGNSKAQPGIASYRALHRTKNVPGLTAQSGLMRRSLHRDCLGEDCPDFHNRGCSIHCRILLMLPLVNPFQVYQVDTGSINTILDFQTALNSANRLQNMGQGMGTVFKLYKVDAKKGGLDSENKKVNRKYKYMSCEIAYDFWDIHGAAVLEKIKQIKGMNFISKNIDELKQLNSAITNAKSTIAGAVESDKALIESRPVPQEIKTAPAPEKKDPTVEAAKNIENSQELKDDPEIVAAVKSIYDAKGKPVPKNAVVNALAKYKENKAAILEAASKALAGMKSAPQQGSTNGNISSDANTSPPPTAPKDVNPPPPQSTSQPNQQQNGGTLL